MLSSLLGSVSRTALAYNSDVCVFLSISIGRKCLMIVMVVNLGQEQCVTNCFYASLKQYSTGLLLINKKFKSVSRPLAN